jgi:hypothetical protein
VGKYVGRKELWKKGVLEKDMEREEEEPLEEVCFFSSTTMLWK